MKGLSISVMQKGGKQEVTQEDHEAWGVLKKGRFSQMGNARTKV